jgi:hypothetical protein
MATKLKFLISIVLVNPGVHGFSRSLQSIQKKKKIKLQNMVGIPSEYTKKN